MSSKRLISSTVWQKAHFRFKNNPGGYLGAAINELTSFCDDLLIVYTQDRGRWRLLLLKQKGALIDKEVVAADEGSASASEIVVAHYKTTTEAP